MKRICAVLALLIPGWLFAQQLITIDISDNRGQKLAGASLTLSTPKGEKLHTVTDAAGTGAFRTNTNGKAQLKVSFTGFVDLDTSLFINGNTRFSCSLNPVAAILQAVEVRGIRAGQNAPFTKTDLDQAFIEKNNLGQDIPFLLNQTPNVVANSDAGTGVGYTGIRIRGTDASRINMTINGIPYNDPESQGLFFVNLPDLLSSVSSIQVQRGVGTSSNGAGAFGATMNFSTFTYQPAAYAELNNTVGSFQTLKNTLKAGSGLIGKHITIDARVSRISSEGYVERASSRLQSGQVTVGYWGKKTSLRLNVLLGKEKTYQAWYGITAADLVANRRVNYAGTEKPGSPYDNETDNYRQNHYQLFLNHSFRQNVLFNTAFYLTTGEGYYEQYKANARLSSYGISSLPGTSGSTVTRSDLVRRLWLKNKLFGQIFNLQVNKARDEWTIGGGWNHYPAQHFGEIITTAVQPGFYRKWYDYDAGKTDVNLYTKWMHPMKGGNWKWFADLQYRYVHYQIEGFRNNPGIRVNESWHFLNPKAGIFYRKNRWSGFLSYARGAKEPNRDDFEAGTKELPRAEKLHDWEVNITREALLKNLKVSVTGYYMFYRDQLILTGKVNDVGAYTRTNIPVSYRAGVEVEATWRYSKGALRYNGGFSRNKIKSFTEYVDNYDDGTQQKIPHRQTNIALSPSVVQFLSASYKPFRNAEVEWMTKHVSRQFLDNTSNRERSLDPFINQDLRCSYLVQTKGWIKGIYLTAQINNLFNSLYEPNGYTFSYISGGNLLTENYFYPMAVRNYSLSVNIKL